jgi:hypothetical protein
LIATKLVDFRRGADGLAASVRETLGDDPFSGAIPLETNGPCEDAGLGRHRGVDLTGRVSGRFDSFWYVRPQTKSASIGRLLQHGECLSDSIIEIRGVRFQSIPERYARLSSVVSTATGTPIVGINLQ